MSKIRKLKKVLSLNPINSFKTKSLVYKNVILSTHKRSSFENNCRFQLGCSFENVGYFKSSFVLREGAKFKVNGDFSIYSGCRISINKDATFEVGSGYINYGANIACFEHISIGNNVIISENVTIRDSDDHQITSHDHTITKPIKIEDNVWIGLNVTILKGVTIGEGSIIAAGSLVNKDVPPRTLVGGVPAKVIKQNVEWKV